VSASGGASIARVDFFDGGTTIGSSVSAPFSFTWTAGSIGAHSLTAVATDSRGLTATSIAVPVQIVYGQPAIDASPGLDGSTVAAASALITGAVQAPANSGVMINGQLAVLMPDGSFFLDDVPLVEGVNSIALQLTTQDGQTASRTITITRQGSGLFDAQVTPQEALSGTNFAFRTSGPSGTPVATIEFDFNGDGIVDFTARSLDAANVGVSLSGYGVVLPTIVFKDASGTVLGVVQKRIYLRDPIKLYGLVKGVYTDLVSRLATGDTSTADNTLMPEARTVYDPVFSALGANLPAICAQLGTLDGITASLNEAEIRVLRDGASGKQAFFIHLIRGEDGIWRIESM
jgi:hypothetical protein